MPLLSSRSKALDQDVSGANPTNGMWNFLTLSCLFPRRLSKLVFSAKRNPWWSLGHPVPSSPTSSVSDCGDLVMIGKVYSFQTQPSGDISKWASFLPSGLINFTLIFGGDTADRAKVLCRPTAVTPTAGATSICS